MAFDAGNSRDVRAFQVKSRISSLLFGVLAVVLWSSAVAVAARLSSFNVPFAAVAIYGVFFAWLTVVALSGLWRREVYENMRVFAGRRGISLGISAALALAIYEFCFWHALLAGPRIEVNALNYLWPIAQVLWICLLSSREIFTSRLRTISLMGLAYAGAFLCTLGVSKAGRQWNFAFEHGCAVVGAVAVGYYFAASRAVRLNFPKSGSAAVAAWNIVVWPASIIIMVIAARLMGYDMAFPLLAEPVALLLYEGIVVFGLGYFCYIYSIQGYPAIELSGISYFTPILGALWLHLFFGEAISLSVVIGLTLIVLANFLIHSRFRYLPATFAAVFAWAITLLFCYVFQGLGKGELLESLGAIGAILGILVGFTLSRLTASANAQAERYLKLLNEVRLFRTELQGAEQTLSLEMREQMDGFVHSCSAYFFGGGTDRRYEYAAAVFVQLQRLDTAVHVKYGDGQSSVVLSQLNEVREAFDEWATAKTERLTLGEGVVLSCLGTVFICVFCVFRQDSIGGDIGAIVLSASFVYLLFTIRDLDLDRVPLSEERRLLIFNAYARCGVLPFIPGTMIDGGDSILLNMKSPERVLTQSADGSRVEVDAMPLSGIEKSMFAVAVFLLFVASVWMVVKKPRLPGPATKADVVLMTGAAKNDRQSASGGESGCAIKTSG